MDAIAGTTTRYYYDDQRVAVQTLVSGAVETDDRYFVFGNYIDEVLLSVIPAQAGTPDLYYAHDHLYSPVALFADNGAVAERYEYDVYGFCRILDSNFDIRISSLYGTPYAFTGRERDILDAGNLRLMHYRHRDYSPQLGRFMQHDPLEYIDGMNVYEYGLSSPTHYRDPFGFSGCDNPCGSQEDINREYQSCRDSCNSGFKYCAARGLILCTVFSGPAVNRCRGLYLLACTADLSSCYNFCDDMRDWCESGGEGKKPNLRWRPDPWELPKKESGVILAK